MEHNADAKQYNAKCNDFQKLLLLHDIKTNAPHPGLPETIEIYVACQLGDLRVNWEKHS
jgi:hypothetical protein